MYLTVNEVMKASESYNKIDKTKFSLKTAYKLARLFRNLETETKCYEDTVRETILKYSLKDTDGNPIIKSGDKGDSVEIPPENQQKCMTEIEELNNTQIEINDCFFTLEDFGDLTISIEEIQGLLPFIKEN